MMGQAPGPGSQLLEDRSFQPPPIDAAIADLLGEGLGRYFARSVRVVRVESEPLETQSTYPIGRLRVTLTSGERLPVIFKRLHPGTEPKGGRREVLIYRRLLAGRCFGAPALYASVYDEAGGRYWLFLEDLGEWTLAVGDLDEWFAAVRWLADMHGRYLGQEDELRALGCLGEHGPAYYHTIAGTARRNLQLAGARSALVRFDRLLSAFDALVASLVRQPRTLVHGDIFPDNLLIQPGPRTCHVRPIDWESAAIGLPAWDLTRLLDGWEAKTARFIEAYLAELAQRTAEPVDRRAFDRVFARCQFLNVLWHLGWSVEACRDPAFVGDALDRLEHLGSCPDGVTSDG